MKGSNTSVASITLSFFVAVSRKRKASECDDCASSDISHQNNASTKYKLEEGFSWWTCLQYDMPFSRTKPQPVATNGQSKH